MNAKYLSLAATLFVASSASINANPLTRLFGGLRAVGHVFVGSFKDGCAGVRDLYTGDSVKAHNECVMAERDAFKAQCGQTFDDQLGHARERHAFFKKPAPHLHVSPEFAQDLALPGVENGFPVYDQETGGIVDSQCLISSEQLPEVRAAYVDAKVANAPQPELLSASLLPRLKAIPSLFKSWITAQDAPSAKVSTVAGRVLAVSAVVGGVITTVYLLKKLLSGKKSKKDQKRALRA